MLWNESQGVDGKKNSKKMLKNKGKAKWNQVKKGRIGEKCRCVSTMSKSKYNGKLRNQLKKGERENEDKAREKEIADKKQWKKIYMHLFIGRPGR